MTVDPRDELLDVADTGDGRCITCGDTAIWMRVLAVDASRALADCAGPGDGREIVDTGLVDAVRAGDSLLVHAGAALQRRAHADEGPDRGPA